MKAAEFARKRARIEQRAAGRPAAFLRKAVAHLVRDAGAAAVSVNGHMVGWQMPAGGFVCVKYRYRDEDSAVLELERIIRLGQHQERIPVRHYACPYCGGWHLTSQPKAAPVNDNYSG